MAEDSIHLEYLCLLETHITIFADLFANLHDLLSSFVEVKERIRSTPLQSWPLSLLRLLFVAKMS